MYSRPGPVLKSPSVQRNSRSNLSSTQLVGARIEKDLSWPFKKEGANLLWVESASSAHFVRTKSRKATLLKFSWIKNGRKTANYCERRWEITKSSPQLESVKNERESSQPTRPHPFKLGPVQLVMNLLSHFSHSLVAANLSTAHFKSSSLQLAECNFHFKFVSSLTQFAPTQLNL